jgi:ubiquinone/menaquinone biosynthesis C-methylase UbiE
MNWHAYWNEHPRVRSADPCRQVGRTFRQRSYTPAEQSFIEQRIIHLLDAGRGKTLLDLACGNGMLTRRLAERFDRITAVDFSGPLLATARRDYHHPRIEYILGDVLAFEFPESAFDCVLMYAALQYFSPAQAKQLLAGIRKALKPSGRILLGDVPDRDRRANFYRGAAARARYWFDQLRGRPIIGHWWSATDLLTLADRYELDLSVHYQTRESPNHYFRYDAVLTRQPERL